MSRALDDLHPDFRPLAVELLARLTEAGIMVKIVDTLRTPEEHQANLAKGVSWTKRSLHLDGLAIDVAPYQTYDLHGGDKLQWSAEDPVWQEIGSIGKRVRTPDGHGLRWGGDWRKRRDYGHFEHPLARKIRQLSA